MARGRRPAPPDLDRLAPVRLAEWTEKDDGRVVVERPRNHRRGALGLWDRVSYAMSMRFIRFDPVGSLVWKRLDGRRTVAEVAAEVREEFGEAAEPVGRRVGLFVSQLHQLELVRLPGYAAPSGREADAADAWREPIG